ncbi:hypothetical protein KC367_g280 [Hortaea werneckii]|nr:hypothetical protein KC367_g280 [Hortaea werneckii]
MKPDAKGCLPKPGTEKISLQLLHLLLRLVKLDLHLRRVFLRLLDLLFVVVDLGPERRLDLRTIEDTLLQRLDLVAELRRRNPRGLFDRGNEGCKGVVSFLKLLTAFGGGFQGVLCHVGLHLDVHVGLCMLRSSRSSCILLELLLEPNDLIFEAVDLVVGVCEAFLIASEQMIVTIHDDPCQWCSKVGWWLEGFSNMKFRCEPRSARSWVRKARNIMAPPVFSVASLARASFRIQKIKSRQNGLK